jgi:DNA-binding NarL/FixJ family response regulator
VLRKFREHARAPQTLRSRSGRGVALTSRELEVMALLQRGIPTAEIAARLRITTVTVRRHVSAVLRKLEVPDRQSAVELLDAVRRRPQ